jgi:hypothetical protein
VCVEELHKQVQALGHVVGRPTYSEAKRTKSMNELLGIELKTSNCKQRRRNEVIRK